MTTCKEQYTDDDGLIITASQHRVLERRKKVKSLWAQLRPKYASQMCLYTDIAEQLKCSRHVVIQDLRHMGLLSVVICLKISIFV